VCHNNKGNGGTGGKRMKILVTGINGFVGSHLVEFLQKLDNNIEIFGICRWRSNRENLYLTLKNITLLDADLLDLGSLIRIFEDNKPDIIFHLAAQSYVVSSYNYPLSTISTNTIGTANLLEAIRILKFDPIVHICGSSEVYGMVKKEYVPIKETCPFNPSSPYAVGKIGEDMVSLQYYNAHGIKTIRTRAFSHTGPRRGDVFAASSFSKQLASIRLGLQKNVIQVGNTDSIRTFCDVRDMARAYWLAATKCDPGEVYNIGGIETMTIEGMLHTLIKITGIDPEIKQIKTLLRPTDVTLQIPCIDKFTQKTGWKPEIPFKDTLKDLFEYWIKELSAHPWKYRDINV
jgi:GDP-mannose 4,6-dehydratase